MTQNAKNECYGQKENIGVNTISPAVISDAPAEPKERDQEHPHTGERGALERAAVLLGHMTEQNASQTKELQNLARKLSEAGEERAAFLLHESADSIGAENGRLREAQAILIRRVCS
jgi:hypothetical protein